MYTLGRSRKPAFQLPAIDIPSSSTPLMFQAHLSTFDMGAEDQLAWDQIRYDDILAIMEGAPQQADDLAVSQLTQPPRVLSQPSHLAAVQSDHGRWSDIGGRWSDTGRQSDTDRQSDTGCCRLVASGHGDTFSRPARTASRQGTGPWAAARSDHGRRSDTGGRQSDTGCCRLVVGGHGARAERRHRAPPSRHRHLGSVPSVVPTEDVDAGDVRACYHHRHLSRTTTGSCRTGPTRCAEIRPPTQR
jgi:hypothetical protein